jgi:hypothetical protein
MTARRLADGIFLLRFDSQYTLASTFLRFQEHYESSRFRNRVFTLEEYMDWYAKRFGAFTYYEDWSGFNVPSSALTAFYEGKFDPLSLKEARFLRLFRRLRRPFYVIGVASEIELTHELAHALFSTRPAYRAAVLRAMRGHDTSALRRQLTALGYHQGVLTDEVHAYLVDGGAARAPAALVPLQRTLRRTFREHAAAMQLAPKTRVTGR